jgi:hypothetical protein
MTYIIAHAGTIPVQPEDNSRGVNSGAGRDRIEVTVEVIYVRWS